MAAIDIAGFVADLKAHAPDHGFHVHDERHFIETYSLQQVWQIELHPEEACGGPLDLHVALEADARVQLSFEDAVGVLDVHQEPDDLYFHALTFNWALPPLGKAPGLLILATELAGIGGVELPLRVSAADSYHAVTDPPERTLTLVASRPLSLKQMWLGELKLCDDLDRAMRVSEYLLAHAPAWLGD